MKFKLKFKDNTEHTITLTDELIREVESLLDEREYNDDLDNIQRQKEQIINHIKYNLPETIMHKEFLDEDEDVIFPLEDLVSNTW